MSEWVSKWVNEWVSEWVSQWVIEWVCEWVSGWKSEWVSKWVSECVSEWVSEWMSEWVEWLCECEWGGEAFYYIWYYLLYAYIPGEDGIYFGRCASICQPKTNRPCSKAMLIMLTMFIKKFIAWGLLIPVVMPTPCEWWALRKDNYFYCYLLLLLLLLLSLLL